MTERQNRELKKKLIDRGMNMSSYAQELGITRQNLSKKTHAGGNFTVDQIKKSKKILDLTAEELEGIFIVD